MNSYYLLAAIMLFFIAQLSLPWFTDAFIFKPDLLLSEPWRIFTSMFMHSGLTHLFFNGFALLMFGPYLESIIGPRRFLALFFAAGLAGSLLYWLTYAIGIIPAIPALGASGAIYGLLGALAYLRPNMMIYMWFFPMQMYQAAFVWVLFGLYDTMNTASGIAGAAHLGGLFLGLAYAHFVKKSGKRFEFHS
jgi:membrane associated rhomboid family serine protease